MGGGATISATTIANSGNPTYTEPDTEPDYADADTAYTLTFAAGTAIDDPMLIFFFARIGLVSARQLLRWFRWAVLLIFVTAAIITPTPDVATQTVFAVPMILLYLLGVGVAAIFGTKKDADDD